MKIKQDKYNVVQSKVGKVIGKGSDIKLDLQLDFNNKQPNIGATITGKVVDINNNAIQGAIVKLVDDNLQPLTNSMTDANGNYSIDSLPFSSLYKIIATAAGKIIFQTNAFTLLLGENKTINIVLENDGLVTLGSVSGSLKDIKGTSIQGAIVLLYNLINGTNNLMAITYSDNSGIFVFSELNPGSYNIAVTALGYLQGQIITSVQSGNITTFSMVLNENPQAANGIISGVITDASNSTVSNADVLLYKVEITNTLTPMAFTSTNSAGIYTFINVPPGNYLVKSNQSQVITIEDTSAQTYTVPTTITSTTAPISYFINFAMTQNYDSWKVKKDLATLTLNNGNLNIKTTSSIIIDDNSPTIDNGIYQVTFKYTSNDSNDGRIGFIFRYVDNNNWAGISYDYNKWIWQTSSQYGDFGANLPTLQVNKQYKITIQYNINSIILIISGEALSNSVSVKQVIPQLPIVAGKIGFINWYVNKNIQISEISSVKISSQVNVSYIQSNLMRVALDSNYPKFIEYKWNSDGAVLDGQREPLYIVEINSSPYIPSISSNQIDSKAIEYSINFNSIQVIITMKISLINDNALKVEFTSIKEMGSFKVQTINFPSNNLVSIKSTDNGQIATVINIGDRANWNNVVDEFKSVAQYSVGTVYRAYAIVNNNNFVATLNNNIFEGASKIALTVQDNVSYKQATLNNPIFVYRQIFENSIEVIEPLPWFQIMIGRDVNGNGIVDWQDGAILFRQNKAPIVGADLLRNSMSYAALNIGSCVQSAFLKVADQIKKIYNYTDGFGQLSFQRGYQGEGHDDVIADISGHVGIRQGGKDDLNKLIDIAGRYNAKIGLHVNVTEYHLDSFQLNVNNLQSGFIPGWIWFDVSYLVNKERDIYSGDIERKFNMLANDHPGLKWIMIDVYEGNGWAAKKLQDIIKSHGWMLGTEYSGPLEENVAWTSWSVDLYVAKNGNGSKISRFIRNSEQDVFVTNDLLKGGKIIDAQGWYGHFGVDGYTGIETFYNHILPTRYMQHFDILEWPSNDYVKFSNGLEVKREGININMYKDSALIASTLISSIDSIGIGKTKLFIPWFWAQGDGNAQNKIYHWNPDGGESTWQVPNIWNGISSIKVYQLSDKGRTYISDIPIVNGKVTINALSKVPYVVFPANEVISINRIKNWGEGSLISNPGFDSENISDSWILESTANNFNHINLMNESTDLRNGNDLLIVQGNNGANAIISQVITGLISGKVYIASVWVKSEGNRKVILGINCGGQIKETFITKQTTRVVGVDGTKWIGDKFTRLRVEFLVPTAITVATLYVNISSDVNNSRVFIDDFRLWTNPNGNITYLDKSNYALYENFENVDQGYGPFYLAHTPNVVIRTHFVEKNPNGGQYMNWVINERFSLKLYQDIGDVGEILVTDESTLKLQANTSYELGFKYTCKISLYSVSIKSPTMGILFKTKLPAGNVVGKPEDGPTYSREVKIFKYQFTTGNANDYYLAFEKEYGFDEFILDDIYIISQSANINTNLNLDVNSVYFTNFNTLQSSNWKYESGVGTSTLINGYLNLNTTDSIIIDENSPNIDNGIYRATFKYSSNDSNEGRLGFIFRYSNANSWVAISYDINQWVWKIQGQYGQFSTILPNLQLNKQYTIVIEYYGNYILVTLSGEALPNGSISDKKYISQIPVNAGKVGMESWYVNKNINLSIISSEYVTPLYYRDINTNFGNWKYEVGTGTISSISGKLNLTLQDSIIIDENSPTLINGIYKMTFDYISSDPNAGRIGFVFRYVDPNNWCAINYDINQWIWQIPGQFGIISGSLPALQQNQQYDIILQYNNNDIIFTVINGTLQNGAITIKQTIPQLTINSGMVGVKSWYSSKVIEISKFSLDPTKNLYFEDFNTINTSGNWQIQSDSAIVNILNGVLKINTQALMLIDKKSPVVANGSYKIGFKYTSNDLNAGRIGFVFRYIDANNWCSINYDSNQWVWQASGQYGVFGSKLPILQLDKKYDITIQFYGNNIKVILSGAAIANGSIIDEQYIQQFTTKEGQIGLRSWYSSKNIEVYYVFIE